MNRSKESEAQGGAKTTFPRIMVAAPSSGSGKTMVTCGLLALLKRRGYRTAAFKCGPDYIDPMFHTRVLKVPSGNLDPFFCGAEENRRLFARRAAGKDLSVVEGVMGYYDGVGGVSTRAGSYDLAGQLKLPVLLVVSCAGAGGSVAAVVRGFASYRSPSYLRGVILNQVQPRMYPQMKELIEQETGLLVAGYLPDLKEARFKSRYLGLQMPDEIQQIEEKIRRIADVMEETVDLDQILRIADAAGEIRAEEPNGLEAGEPDSSGYAFTMAVARDAAFCFAYEDNWELLRERGARIVFFSPLEDPEIPADADGLWLPGGYPELFAGRLEENESMRRSVREAVKSGMPTVAECGGFLYLQERLEQKDGGSYRMAGVFPGAASFAGRLKRFGYIDLQARQDTLLLRAGQSVPSHEFHYWEAEEGEACVAVKASGQGKWPCVRSGPSLFAGFPHIYLPARPEMASRLAEACARYGAAVRVKNPLASKLASDFRPFDLGIKS